MPSCGLLARGCRVLARCRVPELKHGGAAIAYGVNDYGQVVGNSGYFWYLLPCLLVERGYRQLKDLGDLPGGHGSYAAARIDQNGEVVGTAFTTTGTPHAFIWEVKALACKQALYYQAMTAAVLVRWNNKEHVVGTSYCFKCKQPPQAFSRFSVEENQRHERSRRSAGAVSAAKLLRSTVMTKWSATRGHTTLVESSQARTHSSGRRGRCGT